MNDNDHTREAIEYDQGAAVNDEPVEEVNEERGEQDGDEEHRETATPAKRPAHFRNPDIHFGWRYGIPAFLIGTLAFLFVADISSGVSAKTQLFAPDGRLVRESLILTVSIVSSVKELWDAESYALAVFICITSVLWPYLKLLLSLAAWMVPIRNIEKRERFIEIVDALDKWSFVDIFVLIVIMVAFNNTIEFDNNIDLDVLIIPKWGFHAFVAANMLSLVGTQAILYQHRQVQYYGDQNKTPEEEQQVEQTIQDQKATLASKTNTSAPVLICLLASCVVLHVVGCALDIYEVSNNRSGVNFSVPYSVFSIGTEIPGTGAQDGGEFGLRWIQFMFFLFAVALPPWNSILFAVLYLLPMTPSRMEKAFFWSEITFSWAAVEVFTVSVIFSILQIPKFGNGLIDSGCAECYEVDSKLRPEFAVLIVSTVLNVSVNIWLFLRAHKGVFSVGTQ